MPVSPARAAAFEILMRVEHDAAYASELLHSSRCAELSKTDQALTTELVMGVLRWRSRLDSQIVAVSSKPLAKLDLEVVTALRLGAYQLGWLDRIPSHAAIHESVDLVKQARKRSAVPFANAVLRKLDAKPLRERRPASIGQSLAQAPSAKDLAEEFAHPSWIVDRWVKQFGLGVSDRICQHDQQVPPTAIRLRDSDAEMDLRAEGIELEPGEFLASARYVVSGDVTRTKVFAANRVAIQDEASQLVAALVGRGNRILDGCAAPGGKTWSIADHNPHATIIAVELHGHRVELLRKRVKAPNVHVVASDLKNFSTTEPFDRVLLDVPCSGTGTLARNPEIKWRLSRQDLRDLAARQASLLRAALKHVSQDGRLIYSTCSLEREENESVVEAALAEDASFRLIQCSEELARLRDEGEWISPDIDSFVRGPYLRTIPGLQRCDGFFAAIFERK